MSRAPTSGPRQRRRWIRVPPGRRDNLGAALAAGALAAGVGVLTFYVTRLFLAREPLDGPPGPSPGEGGADGGPGGA